MDSQRPQFSLEALEARIVPSAATPITFDPDGTLIKKAGSVNGQLFIKLSGSGGSEDVFGVPGTGSDGSSPNKARVFATDLDGDDFLDANEITGIALNDGAKVIIYGSVNGDIVTNLKGTNLSGENKDGSVLISSNIAKLEVRGSVFGDIITGKSLNKVKIDGSVENLVVGTAAMGWGFQFHGPAGPSVELSGFSLKDNNAGGSIRDVTIGGGIAGLYASDGGPSGNGGSISGITIENDALGLIIQAGNAGNEPTRNGAHGGEVSKLEINTSEGVTILAGHGSSTDRDGSDGGEGGLITGVKINALGPVTMVAGDGGAASGTNGKGGIGGEITKSIFNGSDITLLAGNGGNGTVEGGEGGEISSIKSILAGEANLFGGDGGDSSVLGGLGGSVYGLKFFKGSEDAMVRSIVAGDGGTASVENADGGSIRSVKFDGDIGDFLSSYGVDSMGGLFAGLAGGNESAIQAVNGNVSGIQADRIAAIVAGTNPLPRFVTTISGIKASAIGANFDTDVDSEGGNEPALDYFESLGGATQYDLGELLIDGIVLGRKITGLSVAPLFVIHEQLGIQSTNVDPHIVP
jgi:hypothetical protein